MQVLPRIIYCVSCLMTLMSMPLCFALPRVYAQEAVTSETAFDGVYVTREMPRLGSVEPYPVEKVRVKGGKIIARTKIALLAPYYALSVSPSARYLVYVKVTTRELVSEGIVNMTSHDTKTGKTRSFPVQSTSPNFGFWSPSGTILPVYGYAKKEYQINFVSPTFSAVKILGSGVGRTFRSFHWLNKDNSFVYSVRSASPYQNPGFVYYRGFFATVKGKTVVQKQQISLKTAQKLTGVGVEKVTARYERDSTFASACSSYPISRKQGKVFGISEMLQEQAPGDTLPLWAGNNYVYLYDKGVFHRRKVYMGDYSGRATWSKSERYIVYHDGLG